jgi:hypothetical protein
MGKSCSTYGEGRGEMHTEFWWGHPKEDHLKDPGIDGRTILNCIFKKWEGSMAWMNLAQERNKWRALVTAVMNIRVSLNAENFLSGWVTFSFARMHLLHTVSYGVTVSLYLFSYPGYRNMTQQQQQLLLLLLLVLLLLLLLLQPNFGP